jgi:DNA-binding protein H-NS
MAKAPVSIDDLDLEQLADEELRHTMQRVREVLNGRFTSRAQEFRELAREMGFSVTLSKPGKEDGRRGKRQAQKDDRRRGVSAKYRNPDNPTETWAGRGLRPKWVADKLAQGASLDDLLINREVSGEVSDGAPGV